MNDSGLDSESEANMAKILYIEFFPDSSVPWICVYTRINQIRLCRNQDKWRY